MPLLSPPQIPWKDLILWQNNAMFIRELPLCYFFEVMGPDSSFFLTLFSMYWCSLWLKSVNFVNRNVVQVSKNPQSHAFQASRCLYVSSLSFFFFFFMQDYDDLCGKSSMVISIGFLQNSWLLSTDFCREEKKGSPRVCQIHKNYEPGKHTGSSSSSLIQSFKKQIFSGYKSREKNNSGEQECLKSTNHEAKHSSQVAWSRANIQHWHPGLQVIRQQWQTVWMLQ